VVVGVDEGEVGDPVMDERDLFFRHVIDVPQESDRLTAHHDQLGREPGDL
jgi:hypothetical protein